MKKSEPTVVVQIFIAGDIGQITNYCRYFCMLQGLCVTIEPTTFVYTGGLETGAAIRLINYPRFPSTEEALMDLAERLANELIKQCSQWSAIVIGPTETRWLSTRPDRQ